MDLGRYRQGAGTRAGMRCAALVFHCHADRHHHPLDQSTFKLLTESIPHILPSCNYLTAILLHNPLCTPSSSHLAHIDLILHMFRPASSCILPYISHAPTLIALPTSSIPIIYFALLYNAAPHSLHFVATYHTRTTLHPILTYLSIKQSIPTYL